MPRWIVEILLEEPDLNVVCTLVPWFARLTTKPTKVDQGKGVLLHRPLDVLFQEGVSGLACHLQFTTSLLQFVVQDWFQQQAWAAHSVHRLEDNTTTHISQHKTKPFWNRLYPATNTIICLLGKSILRSKHTIPPFGPGPQQIPSLIFESSYVHKYSTWAKPAHSTQSFLTKDRGPSMPGKCNAQAAIWKRGGWWRHSEYKWQPTEAELPSSTLYGQDHAHQLIEG